MKWTSLFEVEVPLDLFNDMKTQQVEPFVLILENASVRLEIIVEIRRMRAGGSSRRRIISSGTFRQNSNPRMSNMSSFFARCNLSTCLRLRDGFVEVVTASPERMHRA